MFKLISSSIIFFLITTSSFAYIVAIFAALFGLIWFPVKRLLKKRKEQQQDKVD